METKNDIILPWRVVVHVLDLDDAFCVRVQIFFSEALARDRQNKLANLFKINHFRITNPDEAVVAVDLKGSEVIASQEGVNHSLPAAV